jgi:hypothetical protein
MGLFERFAHKDRRGEPDVPTRATCLRCRREYTPEPDGRNVDDYCWWCAERTGQSGRFELFVVTE